MRAVNKSLLKLTSFTQALCKYLLQKRLCFSDWEIGRWSPGFRTQVNLVSCKESAQHGFVQHAHVERGITLYPSGYITLNTV
jgi:hypothetical protein